MQRQRSQDRLFMVMAGVLALAGCAGNGQGLDSSGRPVGESGATGALTADFNSIQANVFTPICTACHAGASAPLGLRLDAGNSYNLLVGVASGESSGTLRVRPGDPNNSYLIQKLEGRAAVGAQMPLGGPPLPAATIAAIRQWIATGAVRGAAGLTEGGVTASALLVTGAAPANGEWLEQAPAQLVLGLSQDLDATRVDALSVQLQRVAGDADVALAATRPVPATVGVPYGNLRAIVITPHEALAAGRYRIVLNGLVGNDVTDLSGRPVSGLAAEADGSRVVLGFDVGGTMGAAR